MSAPSVTIALVAAALRVMPLSAQFLAKQVGAENVELVISGLRARGFEIPVSSVEVALDDEGTEIQWVTYAFSSSDEALYDRLMHWAAIPGAADGQS